MLEQFDKACNYIVPSSVEAKQRNDIYKLVFSGRWHPVSEKSIWGLVFLHYNQQIVSQSQVQKVCDFTDLIAAEIDSEPKDETMDALTWVSYFLPSFFLSLQQKIYQWLTRKGEDTHCHSITCPDM